MRNLKGTLACLMLLSAAACTGDSPSKKLIYYGWGIRDARYVRHHWSEMESTPFDGTAISVIGKHNGAGVEQASSDEPLGLGVFGPRALRLEDFESAIEDLRAARWRRFTDNFIPACLGFEQSQGFTWFDEARWQVVLANWRLLVTVAKRGGLRGIILDPEHYAVRLFNHPAMRPGPSTTFERHRLQVKGRGQQLMMATRAIYPDITILALFGHTLALGAFRAGQLEQYEYGLYPAFLDGMLETAAPETHFVDGFESAYGFKHRGQFQEARKAIRRDALALTSNPRLYRERVEVGFGVWLDHGGQNHWHDAHHSENYFSPAEFRAAITDALSLSDRYVWIYSQGPRFFPPRALPNAYVKAIRAARRRDPNHSG